VHHRSASLYHRAGLVACRAFSICDPATTLENRIYLQSARSLRSLVRRSGRRAARSGKSSSHDAGGAGQIRCQHGGTQKGQYDQRRSHLSLRTARLAAYLRHRRLFDPISADASETENDPLEFTLFTDSKINADLPVREQLNTALKKLLHSHRKSAKEFYEVPKNDIDDIMKLKN